MIEIKWFNFVMGTTTKPRLMEKLFRCCSRLDEPGLGGERQQQGAGIQKCFYQEEQRTGETMRYDVARGWLPNMIALGNDHNVASGGWLPKMIIARNGLGRDDSLPKNSTPRPPSTCQRWKNINFSINTEMCLTSEGTINTMSILTFWHMLCWVFE